MPAALCAAPPARVVVVDNAPRRRHGDARGHHFPGVEYAVEPRPGLDHARNRALALCTTEVLAYTDDDAVPDEWWTTALATAFDEEPDLAMATVLVLPYALDTPAQQVFERLGGFGRGFRRRWATVRPVRAGRRLDVGEWGTGANMAFRRTRLEHVGGFDPALDVGTITGGGGDLDAFHRVLAAGLLVRYEPAAIVRHEHRRSLDELMAQFGHNGAVWSTMVAARDAGRAEPRRHGALPGGTRASLAASAVAGRSGAEPRPAAGAGGRGRRVRPGGGGPSVPTLAGRNGLAANPGPPDGLGGATPGAIAVVAVDITAPLPPVEVGRR